ncbi:YfbU family protein [Rhodovulum marinum]|nr:YfbU family protein [Rhodovulum marinum]
MVLLTASQKKEGYWVDIDLVAELVAYGDEWALSWKYQWFDEEDHPKDPIVSETVKIFEMMRHAKNSAEELGKPELFNDLYFDGFDGNNDEHHGIAQVLVNKLDRFTDIPNAASNSHSAGSLPRYRAMLKRYAPIKEELLAGAQYKLMSEEQLKILAGE